MAMSKKHYIMIARIVRTIVDDQLRANIADLFVVELRKDNPRFDYKRFLVACDTLRIEQISLAGDKPVKSDARIREHMRAAKQALEPGPQIREYFQAAERARKADGSISVSKYITECGAVDRKK